MEKSVDATAEEQKIRELSKKLKESEQNKDINATMSFFTEESILQMPGSSQIEGLKGIREFLEKDLFQLPMEDFDSGTNKIVVSSSGDLAYEVGWYRMPFEGPEGRTFEEGKYIIVWQKIEGEWKYIAACANNNQTVQ